MMRTRWTTALACGTLCLGLLAACGRSAASPPAATAPPPPASAAAGSTAAPAGQAASTAASLPTLTVINSSNTATRAGLFVAETKHYFQQNGVAVQVHYVAGSSVGLSAVVSGHADLFLGSGSQALTAIAHGAHSLVVVGAIGGGTPYQFYVAKGITSPQQLVGKPVATEDIGGTSYVFTVQLLKALHLFGKVRLISLHGLAGEEAAFASHQVVAISQSPDTAMLLPPGSYTDLVPAPYKLGVISDAQSIVTTRAVLQTHRTELVDFLKAYSKGIAYAYAHQGETTTILEQTLRVQPKVAQVMYRIYVQSPPSQGGNELDLTPTSPWVQNEWELANIVASLARNPTKLPQIDLGTAVDTSPMQAVKQSQLWKEIWPHGVPSR